MKGARVVLAWKKGSQNVTGAFKCTNYYEEEADRLFSISLELAHVNITAK